jgi:hypothetical protein
LIDFKGRPSISQEVFDKILEKVGKEIEEKYEIPLIIPKVFTSSHSYNYFRYLINI